jgi:hypothetical protein
MELFLLLVLAHLAADFPLQTERIAAAKCRGEVSGYLKHGLIHTALLILLTHPYFSVGLALLWLVLPPAHILLDLLKNRLVRPEHPADSFAFLLDQSLHLLFIFFAWQLIASEPCAPVSAFYGSMLTDAGLILSSALFGGRDRSVLLLSAAVYGYALLGGAIFIRKILSHKSLRLPACKNGRFDDAQQAGRYIGILERAIILTLTLSGAYTSIAFVLTAKSIARYKELENKDFAEYYLVGTLLSALIAILGGLFLRSFW